MEVVQAEDRVRVGAGPLGLELDPGHTALAPQSPGEGGGVPHAEQEGVAGGEVCGPEEVWTGV